MMNLKFYLSLILLFFVSILHAQEVLPKQCEPYPITQSDIFLKGDETRVVLIHNLLSSDLWIVHAPSEKGMSAGWSSVLKANQWSALRVKAGAFRLSCIESRPGHEQQVSCQDAASVCEWALISQSNKQDGTYWIAEDMSLSSLIAYIARKGYKVPVHQNK